MPQLPVILTAFANSYDADYLAHLEQEQDHVRQILAPLSYLRHVPLANAKTEQLVDTLTQYHKELLILHFGGHADSEHLYFKDKGGHITGMAENLSLHPQLKLVFLNGCNTQAQAKAYLNAGVPAVIATTCSVADGQAMQFAKSFYDALTKGHTLEEAFIRAKGMMKLADGANYRDEIMKWRGLDLGETEITEVPWRLYVLEDEILVWKLEMVKSKVNHYPVMLNNVPTDFDLGTDCIGREEELAAIHHKLIHSPKVALVRGLGGIGKTTLVQAYVAVHQNDYQHIIWVTQGSDLITTIALDPSLTQSLKLPFQEKEDLGTRFIQIMQVLRTIPGPNLLVIDNATEQVAQRNIVQQLPNAPHWKVLVTSRQDLPGFVVLELDELKQEAALRLFRLHYDGGADEELMELLEEINCHTLMIELMAKTLKRKRGALSVVQLLKNFRNQQLNDPRLEEKIWVRHSDETGIFNYLMRLYELVDLNEKEIWVLQQFAVLPTRPIEATLLADWLRVDEHELIQTLNELTDRGWLSIKEDGFVIHRIVQEVVKYQQNPGVEELEELLETMSIKMSEGTSANPIIDNFPWVPYAEKVAEHFSELETLPENVSKLWNNLANILRDLGDYPRAAQLLQKALESGKHNFGPEHPNVVTNQANLAMTLRELGDYSRAAELLESALEIAERNFESERQSITTLQSNLAIVLSDLGNYSRAVQLLEKSVENTKRNCGEDHQSVSVSQSNLASVYQDLGNYPDAIKLLESALKRDLLNFGEDHPNIAYIKSNLGNVFRDLGQYDQAVEFHESALKILKYTFGEKHPKVAMSQSNLGLTLRLSRHHTRAAQLFKLALVNYLHNFGENHPEVAMCQVNWALVLHDLGAYSQAAQLFQLALDSLVNTFGESHPKVATCQLNLSATLRSLGQYERAAQLLQHAMKSDLNNFGEHHPKVALYQWTLATIYYKTDRLDEAKLLLEQALQTYEKTFGVNHPYYLEAMKWLRVINKKLNNPNQAIFYSFFLKPMTMSSKPIFLLTKPGFLLVEVVYGLTSRDCRGMGICKIIAASPTLLNTATNPCGSSIAWAGMDDTWRFQLYVLRQTINTQQWVRRFAEGYFLMEEAFEVQGELFGQVIRIEAGRYTILEEGSYLRICF